MMIRATAASLALLLSAPAFAEDVAPPSIQVAFSPHAGATEAVVQVISEAKHTIHLAAYNFSSPLIIKALIDAHNRGVDVECVLDKSNDTAHYSGATAVANAGIPTRIDSQYRIMHNKTIVVDGVTVETGSFNFSTSAETGNAENVVILRNYLDVAAKYEDRWALLWNESVDYPRH